MLPPFFGYQRPLWGWRRVECGISLTLIVHYGYFHPPGPLTYPPVNVPKYAELGLARHEHVSCGGSVALGFLGG